MAAEGGRDGEEIATDSPPQGYFQSCSYCGSDVGLEDPNSFSVILISALGLYRLKLRRYSSQRVLQYRTFKVA